MSLILMVVFNSTSVFTLPTDVDGNFYNNVVYSADSEEYVLDDVYFNIGHSDNDLRQPLFALFALPFSLPAEVFSMLLPFIPNVSVWLLMSFQYALLCTTILLLAKLLKLNKFGFFLFFTYAAVSYPFMLFAFTVEQYTVPLFWLVLLLYNYCVKAGLDDRLLFTGAAGSMITSGVTLPFALKGKGAKQLLCEVFRLGLVFFSTVTLLGKLPYFLDIIGQLRHLLRFSGIGFSMTERFIQYSHFAQACFLAPNVTISDVSPFSYQMAAAENLNMGGLALLLFVVLGFLLTRKELISKICAFWVVFSVVILVIVGWGVFENAMVLYSLYFNWAYLVLAYQAFKRLTGRFRLACNLLAITICASMFAYNTYEIFTLILFGIKYFPAGGASL
jgi:hypothetical protein